MIIATPRMLELLRDESGQDLIEYITCAGATGADGLAWPPWRRSWRWR